MTILALTEAHLVEFEAGILTIARYSDGRCLALSAKGIAGQFRDCLRSHSAERATATFIRMAESAHRRAISKPGYRSPLGCMDGRDANGWQPLYKPERMPRSAA